ncbi:MAG: FHA domain-containing protein [Myxococcales bacterium]|nr:FHA domain-containing protein [Myxococcales bacterium]
MSEGDHQAWHPASFVEHVRSLERDEYLESLGAGLEDRGSKNGTFVNGSRIEGRVDLASGDELRVGTVRALLADGIGLWSALSG